MRLKDIAAELGVSISTVSRALNHPELNAAGPELTQQILAIASRENYAPDPVALRLKASAEQDDNLYILIALPLKEIKDDPFYNLVISGITREAAACHRTIRCTYQVPEGGVRELLQNFHPETLGDAIIVGRFSPEFLPRLQESFRHIVYVGLNRLDITCDQVVCDGYEAAQDALNYLYRLGHRCIGFLGAEKEQRCQGFLRGVEKLGLAPDAYAIEQTDGLSLDNGYRALKNLRRHLPSVTAVVCANDMMAIGALQACKDNGCRVPEDISLIGMVDVPNTRFVEPKLTSISVPMEEMGRIAVRALEERRAKTREVSLRLMVPYTLMERSSCCKINKVKSTAHG